MYVISSYSRLYISASILVLTVPSSRRMIAISCRYHWTMIKLFFWSGWFEVSWWFRLVLVCNPVQFFFTPDGEYRNSLQIDIRFKRHKSSSLIVIISPICCSCSQSCLPLIASSLHLRAISSFHPIQTMRRRSPGGQETLLDGLQ